MLSSPSLEILKGLSMVQLLLAFDNVLHLVNIGSVLQDSTQHTSNIDNDHRRFIYKATIHVLSTENEKIQPLPAFQAIFPTAALTFLVELANVSQSMDIKLSSHSRNDNVYSVYITA